MTLPALIHCGGGSGVGLLVCRLVLRHRIHQRVAGAGVLDEEPAHASGEGAEVAKLHQQRRRAHERERDGQRELGTQQLDLETRDPLIQSSWLLVSSVARSGTRERELAHPHYTLTMIE